MFVLLICNRVDLTIYLKITSKPKMMASFLSRLTG